MQALVQPGTEPFWLALMVVAGLGLVEILSVLLGASASGLLDDGLGYHGPDHSDAGLLGGWMSWLNAGGVPLLVLAVIFFSAFAAIGFGVQSLASGILAPLPVFFAVPACFALALPVTRWSSRGVARIIPRDETSAVSQSDLVGLLGTVTLGPLDQGHPGNVRVRDGHGNIHLLRATAAPGHVIETGALVVIADGADGLFQAIPAPPELAANQGG
ncbi:OB-fold-containig protein [Terrihabitans sp. B22-R8]|uniref:OB-fold-containig protein n=1 Tax=Terrihabitans sp. B22-R8 TaxID=3425128 RepID=UPI00403C7EB9